MRNLAMEAGPVKVVCLSGRLGERLEAVGGQAREHVVMVRVDHDALERLDAWVETGAVRSSSEAAALFIQEGLALRARELEELRAGIDRVREAKEWVRTAVGRVLGTTLGGEDDGGACVADRGSRGAGLTARGLGAGCGGHVTVATRVNGLEAVLIVDTGASTTVLDSGAATRLGVRIARGLSPLPVRL